MSQLTILVLAFSMSADAFAASVGKGAALDRPPVGEALRCGLIFGIVEAITPVVGWSAGSAAGAAFAAFDHWVASAILAILGGIMLRDAVRGGHEVERPRRHSTGSLVITAIGTSIDALALGVTLALVNAAIAATALAIGSATFAMTTIGTLFGRFLGQRLGRVAEALGGAGLILIGVQILARPMLAL